MKYALILGILLLGGHFGLGFMKDHLVESRTCPNCQGTGAIDLANRIDPRTMSTQPISCRTCRGDGKLSPAQERELAAPPDVASEQ